MHYAKPTYKKFKHTTYYKTKWNQFLLVVKSTALKQQISKCYSLILSTEDNVYIYDRNVTGMNVVACFCAWNL